MLLKKEQFINNETVLDNLLRTGHIIDYQCRDGYCGSCQIKLITGKTTYVKTPLAHILPNHILSCCAVLKTETIQIQLNIKVNHNMT